MRCRVPGRGTAGLATVRMGVRRVQGAELGVPHASSELRA